jgi:glycosyltransferase involved in cell wall biosynthesis
VKEVVIIPAHNEKETIAELIRAIPRGENASKVEVVVLDDASNDGTAEVAQSAGAMLLRSRDRLGLARQFQKGLDEALRLGADLIVNIDADMQYDPREIPRLVEPIVRGEADIVLGSRFAGSIEHMKPAKRLGNRLLTFVVNRLSGTRLSDAQTGFRAFSREAAARISVLSSYTYTQEVIVQASYKGLKIVEVPITFRMRIGKSRLISSLSEYAFEAVLTVLLTYLNYRPLRVFSLLGLAFGLSGLAIGGRPVIQYAVTGHVSPYLPSALLSALLILMGFMMLVVAMLAEMTRSNRKLIEDLLFRQKYRLDDQ